MEASVSEQNGVRAWDVARRLHFARISPVRRSKSTILTPGSESMQIYADSSLLGRPATEVSPTAATNETREFRGKSNNPIVKGIVRKHSKHAYVNEV